MKGVFKCAKGDDERRSRRAKSSSLGMPPAPSRNIQGRLKRLSLGMPPCIPFFINNHQFVLLHTIFLLPHMLCALLGASCSLLFSFVLLSLDLFVGHNKLDPSMPCLGEKHAPLLPRMLIVFTSIFVECSFFVLAAVMFSSCLSWLFLF